jgi:hypothetical protein
MEAWRMEAVISTLTVIVISTLIIAWLIGIALALSRWRRHPRVSLFAFLAFAMMLVNILLPILLPPIILNYSTTADQIEPIFTAIRIFNGLASVVAWALVLYAIFGWRDGRQKQDFYPPAPPTFGYEPREQNATPGFQQ